MYMVEGRIVCQHVLGKAGGKKLLETRYWIHVALDFCQHKTVCEHSNEPLFYIEDGEFLDQLSVC